VIDAWQPDRASAATNRIISLMANLVIFSPIRRLFGRWLEKLEGEYLQVGGIRANVLNILIYVCVIDWINQQVKVAETPSDAATRCRHAVRLRPDVWQTKKAKRLMRQRLTSRPFIDDHVPS